MTDDELLRYSRQIILGNFGIESQTALKNATVLIIGVGGLGSVSSLYLASSGVGHIILCDFDTVELSNLQRQIIHDTRDIGKLKVESAKETLLKINPLITVTTVIQTDEETIKYYINTSDVVLDGTDNFDSRFKINTLCVETQTPLVSAAVIKYEGQIATFIGYESDKPCYECLYKPGSMDNSCIANGIVAPMAGVIGSLQALEAMKVIIGLSDADTVLEFFTHSLVNKLLLVDGLTYNIRTVTLSKDKLCRICNNLD